MDDKRVALAVIVLLAHMTEAITGFGSTLLALGLGAQLYPISSLVPVLIPLNLGLSVFLAARYRGAIDGAELRGRVLPLAGLGMCAGLAASRLPPGFGLQRLFGLILCVFAARGLARRGEHAALPLWQGRLLLLGAGVMHGLYASGGPMLVAYASARIKDKGIFRSTLSMVWLAGNAALLAVLALSGAMGAQTWKASAWLLPAAAVGAAAGVALHDRVPQKGFATLTHLLLAGAGTLLLR